MYIKCQHCSYEWDYNGKYKNQTTCPDCQKKTKIVEIEGDACD